MEITLNNRDAIAWNFATTEDKYVIDGKEVEKVSEILSSVGKDLVVVGKQK